MPSPAEYEVMKYHLRNCHFIVHLKRPDLKQKAILEVYKPQSMLCHLSDLDGDKWKLSYGRPSLLPLSLPRTDRQGAAHQRARPQRQVGEAKQREGEQGRDWEPHPGDRDHQEWDPVAELH